ncbi:MAG TPA: hypothetical protein ENO19_01065 [Halothiobacillaceae bacterium]|nr:hypothetical protein [Halothiobacillaceae bacterium]
MMSSVLGAAGGGGADPTAIPDSVTIDTGPVNQTAGGGPLIDTGGGTWALGLLAGAVVMALVFGGRR